MPPYPLAPAACGINTFLFGVCHYEHYCEPPPKLVLPLCSVFRLLFFRLLVVLGLSSSFTPLRLHS